MNRDNAMKILAPDGKLYRLDLKLANGRRNKQKKLSETFKSYLKKAIWINSSLEDRERLVIKTHLNPFFGNLHPSDLTQEKIQKYVISREKKNAKPNTLKHELRCLKKAVQTVAPNWELPKYATFNKPKAVNLKDLDHEAAIKVLQIVKQSCKDGETYFRIGLISAFTGMRLKDVMELTEGKLDRKNWIIHFYQSKVEKLRASRRSDSTPLLVSVPLCENLKALFKKIPENKDLDENFFQVHSRGAVTAVYKRAFKKIGMPNHSFKSFRHLFATTLLRAGVKNLKTIQTLMGHTKLETTFKYFHALDEDRDIAIASLPKLEIELGDPKNETV